MLGVLDFNGDDAVHGVTEVPGVDIRRKLERLSELDGVGDYGPEDLLARGRGDEQRWTRSLGAGTDGDLNGGGHGNSRAGHHPNYQRGWDKWEGIL